MIAEITWPEAFMVVGIAFALVCVLALVLFYDVKKDK